EAERDAAGEEARRIAPREAGKLAGELLDLVLAQASGEASHELRHAASVPCHHVIGRLEILGGRLERGRDLVGVVGGLFLGAVEGFLAALFRGLRRTGGEMGRLAPRSLDLSLE